jgi:excisionase family DNA binding protein
MNMVEKSERRRLRREVYSVEEAAQKLGIGRDSAYSAANKGQIPAIRVGRRIVIPKAAFDRFLAQR